MVVVYLGSMGWSYKFWPIYKGLESKDYLTYYSKLFNSVEVNSTFYRIPRKASVKAWSEQTPECFRFSVKIPQSISHSPSLRYDPEKLDAFLEHIEPLRAKLGPLLLQLPPYLKTENSNQLSILLTQLEGYEKAVEFRHRDWFREDIYDILREHKAALVYVEYPWQPLEKVETGGFAYIRLEGERKKINGEKGVIEIERERDNKHWAEKINQLSEEGKTVYMYVSKFYSGYPPVDIKQIATRLENL